MLILTCIFHFIHFDFCFYSIPHTWCYVHSSTCSIWFFCNVCVCITRTRSCILHRRLELAMWSALLCSTIPIYSTLESNEVVILPTIQTHTHSQHTRSITLHSYASFAHIFIIFRANELYFWFVWALSPNLNQTRLKYLLERKRNRNGFFSSGAQTIF